LVERASTDSEPPPPKRGVERTARYLGAGGTFRLEPPHLRTTDSPDEERHATWFELFFDLVFVAALSQLAGSLARHPTGATFARFAALFVVVVWAWVLYTLYSNRFDTDDLIFRLAKSGAMLAIAAVAVEIPEVMTGDAGGAGFAAGYVVLRVLLIALYLRALYDVPGEGRRLSRINTIGYGATTGAWLASIFVASPSRYILWGLAMGVDVLIPTRAWATLKEHAVTISHLTERFGTFFIIVLGQAVVEVVAGVSGFEFTASTWAVAGICLVIALCLWWIYFDLADTSVVGRGALGLVYVYCHFPLLAGVAVFGVGTKLAIADVSHAGLEGAARWGLAGGVAAFAVALAAIHLGAEWTSMRDRTFAGRILLAAFAVALAAAGGALSRVGFVVLLAAMVLGQLMLEALTPRVGAATVLESHPESASVAHGRVGSV
jgi:low temperature requirement protein LtrA